MEDFVDILMKLRLKPGKKKFQLPYFLLVTGKHEHGCQSHIGQMGIDWRANNLHHKDDGGDDDDDNGHYGDNN